MPNGMYGGVGGRVGKQSLRSYPIPMPSGRVGMRLVKTISYVFYDLPSGRDDSRLQWDKSLITGL